MFYVSRESFMETNDIVWLYFSIGNITLIYLRIYIYIYNIWKNYSVFQINVGLDPIRGSNGQ